MVVKCVVCARMCVFGLWDFGSINVWVQQGDPVDRDTVPELEGPSFTNAFASAILFGHQIVIKAIPAC